MKREPFALECWMAKYETSVKSGIAESGIQPLRTNDFLDLVPAARAGKNVVKLLRGRNLSAEKTAKLCKCA